MARNAPPGCAPPLRFHRWSRRAPEYQASPADTASGRSTPAAAPHKFLVKKRQLHGDSRQFLEICRRIRGAILFVLVIKVDQNVTVHAVGSEQDEHNEIRNQQ